MPNIEKTNYITIKIKFTRKLLQTLQKELNLQTGLKNTYVAVELKDLQSICNKQNLKS